MITIFLKRSHQHLFMYPNKKVFTTKLFEMQTRVRINDRQKDKMFPFKVGF